MNVAVLENGDPVILHSQGREFLATYRSHDSHAVVVEVGGVTPFRVEWDHRGSWIAHPGTDQAYVYREDDDTVPTGDPPERE